MDDGDTAPPVAQRRNKKENSTYIPHELVALILARLPVKSLLRFSCVCKAWRSTISMDGFFHREHLRLQKPFLLVFPQMQMDGKVRRDTLYRWDDSQQGAALPVVHKADLSSKEMVHGLAHCDGLILLPSDATVRVVNPATRRTLTLTWSTHAKSSYQGHSLGHQSFGSGHDPRSNTYKVARFFCRSMYRSTTGGYVYTTGMEVFTIGADRHWREMAEDPPDPVLARHIATFFKGSLVWTIDRYKLGHVVTGFLRFSLEEEAFGVMPAPPPCHERLEHAWGSLAELRGELCLARGADIGTIEMWMCDSIENPQWDQRYTINVSWYRPPHFNPIAIFGDEIVFKEWYFNTRRYNLKTKTYTNRFRMKDLHYRNPNTGMLGYQGKHFISFDVIPYIPSVV